jgi:Protein of unknown function (DUF1822)
MNKRADRMSFAVPLSFEAHAIAQQCCRQPSNPRQAKQVYLNTLAVYAVDFYLRCMEFETDWEASDSRDPLMLKFLDVADLEIGQLGKLECRPVLPDAEVCLIPPEVWSDRIGYVAVQLDPALKQATILGFTQTAAAEVPLNQLQPLDNFLEYLHQLKQPARVNLSNWFDGAIDVDWLDIQQLLGSQQNKLAFGFRNHPLSIARGQQIDLGIQLANQPLALVVALSPEAESEADIQVQVHPLRGQTYLPEGVELSVIDEMGRVVIETESRDADNFIQLSFSAEFGEMFSVTVALGRARVRKAFVL